MGPEAIIAIIAILRELAPEVIKVVKNWDQQEELTVDKVRELLQLIED